MVAAFEWVVPDLADGVVEGISPRQPTRQPVTEYVFDSALMVTTRPSMPGMVAIGM
jgi:hypothetical protein